jgi:rRNA processing protein Gar1
LRASLPAVREGSILIDEKGRRTGKVMELIGSAGAPYLSVQPFTDRIERISGTKLYLGEDEPRPLGRKKFQRPERSSSFRPRGKYPPKTSSSGSQKRYSKRS